MEQKMKKHRGIRWKLEETHKLIKLRRHKVPYKEIAEKLNRSISACETRMHDIRCGLVPEWKENDTIMQLRRKTWVYGREIENCKQDIWYLEQELNETNDTEKRGEIIGTIKISKEDIKQYQDLKKKVLEIIEKAGGVV